jgi:hypothetical protein
VKLKILGDTQQTLLAERQKRVDELAALKMELAGDVDVAVVNGARHVNVSAIRDTAAWSFVHTRPYSEYLPTRWFRQKICKTCSKTWAGRHLGVT